MAICHNPCCLTSTARCPPMRASSCGICSAPSRMVATWPRVSATQRRKSRARVLPASLMSATASVVAAPAAPAGAPLASQSCTAGLRNRSISSRTSAGGSAGAGAGVSCALASAMDAESSSAASHAVSLMCIGFVPLVSRETVRTSRSWLIDCRQHRLCGGRGRLATRDLDRGKGELDAVSLERLLDHRVGAAADHELLARLGGELEADLDRVVAILLDALHLQRLDDVRRELGIRGELAADLLDDALHLVDVGVVSDADRRLVDHPVARVVGDLLQRSERHGMEIAAMMPQLDGP